MLLLTRKIGERIMIGDDVEVIVLDVKGCQVKVGVKAPENIDIYRDEIYWRIKNEAPMSKQITYEESESDT